jgi:hypothetical protein
MADNDDKANAEPAGRVELEDIKKDEAQTLSEEDLKSVRGGSPTLEPVYTTPRDIREAKAIQKIRDLL